MACVLRRFVPRVTGSLNHSLDNFKVHFVKQQRRFIKTGAEKQSSGSSKLKLAFIATAVGIGAGTAYSITRPKATPIALLNPTAEDNTILLEQFPDVKISKTIAYPTDSSSLKLTLFQYTTCPFCCKVRAFLDFYGISYDIVEVNPVFRQQLKWTEYSKVPVLLVKIGDKYLQLNDSSMIISALTSYLHDKGVALKDVANSYPSISYYDDDGKSKKEILNRYFLMFHNDIPSGRTKETIIEERKWRIWADNVLVHVLSPNVYRTKEEAFQAFDWFSEVGEWKKNFSSTEVQLIIYIGAIAMWMIGKRLKTRHRLKEDVRASLYDETNVWLREVRKKDGKFHGGSSPDLADLAVYGVLNSIEGCDAFRDLLSNTKLKHWYDPMKEAINHHVGTPLLVHS